MAMKNVVKNQSLHRSSPCGAGHGHGGGAQPPNELLQLGRRRRRHPSLPDLAVLGRQYHSKMKPVGKILRAIL